MNTSDNLQTTTKGAVLIVGSGVGGMQAALDLADSGFKVHLLQQDSAIGGTMAMLDKTFPTGDCAMCMISPRMVEVGRHPNIELHTLSEVTKVEGQAGNFFVHIHQRPRYVDPDKCTGCGICEDKCPRAVISEFEQGLGKRKAIYSLMPQAIPNTRVIDPDSCIYLKRGKCRACEKFCQAGAINFDDAGQNLVLNVGAVILSPGLSRYDPSSRQELGYKRWPNVVTSIQFERLLSASGPYMGEVKRPSDEKHPKKIAWIQCVGSRDQHNANPWCSGVCCMYATKQAMIAQEHNSEIAPVIFVMDIRAHGKDFDKYVDQAQKVAGVRYQRSMISAVREEPDTKNLILSYTDKLGNLVNERFDLVVLSIGLELHKEAMELAEIFGFDTDKYGFPKTSIYNPVQTTKNGIYVMGTYQSPKDIPETVIQGSAVAGSVMGLLRDGRGTEIYSEDLPPEIDIHNQEPRIGVFVCHCGINISQNIEISQVVDTVGHLPYVVHAEDLLYACSQDSQERIKTLVKEKDLNRVLVASCTPRTHEPLFQETIRDAGLNKYLFELADIREQCSWCLMGKKDIATQKAVEIVKMHVAKLQKMEPLQTSAVSVTPGTLVIGAGIAGITSALALAEQGFQVDIVEREPACGGLLKNVQDVLGCSKIQEMLQKRIKEMEEHPLISIHTDTEVDKTQGFVGNFTTSLKNGQSIDHGTIIIATGGIEYSPEEYGYLYSQRVLTQNEFGPSLLDYLKPNQHIAMIQCVGSREAPHNYCSRICCLEAIKNAIKIKEASPQTQVTIFYRDIRTYGLWELYYQKARELGVLFIRFEVDQKPQVTASDQKVVIQCQEPLLNKPIRLEADYLLLSTGLRPHPSSESVGQEYKLTRNEDGFFLEAHVKLRPVDFSTEGLFVAGLAHGPKTVDESISQALAAAGRAGKILSRPQIEVSGLIAKHNRDLCMSCLSCVRICPFGAPYIDEDGRVSHNEVKCMGCGLCASVCPSKAFQINNFRDDQITAMIDSMASSQST